MLMLRIQGPHFESHCSKMTFSSFKGDRNSREAAHLRIMYSIRCRILFHPVVQQVDPVVMSPESLREVFNAP